MPIAAFILIAVVVIGAIVWYSKIQAERDRQRRAALADFASQNSMTFSEDDRWNLDGRYNGVNDIGKGHDRYALDVVIREGAGLTAFRYHYKTWETRTVSRNGRTYTEQYEATHWCQYLIVELNSRFPSLVLRPEHMFDKLAGFVGFDDIDFESEEFSGKYFCKSDNKEFAYALIHPQMMEYLMNLRIPMQLQGLLLIMDLQHYAYDAPGVRDAMNVVVGLINRIPDFVWQDYGHRLPVKLQDVAYTAPVAPVQ